MLTLRRTRPAIDPRAVDDYLTYLYVPPPRTGIAGVRELPPGCLLRWRPGGVALVERYWSTPTHASPANGHAERVREILEDAVRAHLVSDTPVGVFLSGGLDSSTIVALAARHYPGTLKTFSVTFGDEGKYLDERGFARQVATRFGTDHYEIHAEASAAAILPELVSHFGQPFGNPTAVLTYALSRATREHVKVALAGDGGDEVLGGYPRYQGVWLAEILRSAAIRSPGRMLRALASLLPEGAVRGRSQDRFRRFLAYSGETVSDAYYRWISYLDEGRKDDLLGDRRAFLGTHAPREPYEFLAALRERHGELPMRDAAGLIDLESFLPSNVLAYGDRMSMAHALEVRVPYCDHRVVEEFAALPLATKMPMGVPKGLFRWAMRRDLPLSVLTHRKVGFNPPISAWLTDGLAPVLEEYLGEAAVRARGIFSATAISALRANPGENGHVLWGLLVLEAWIRWLGEQ